MKIYTKTGDGGETSLFAAGRVSKDHLRLHAYGTVDELNTVLGLARALGLDRELDTLVGRIQMELFHVGADLATPMDAQATWLVRVDESMVTALEAEMDRLDEILEPLKNFIVPGGTAGAATLHQARTVCRRAERWVVSLHKEEPIGPFVLRYLNRLSDWLFVVARAANAKAGVGDIAWHSPRQEG
ncbi:MAG: cob(I)yrinic acid a,c-diamide adenosyltransferase [Chloroflexi bacterium]|nr:cob(I)yrinic acid a,c-diamide adenosyltransferase [Chloroflexota bacterium]